MDLADKKIERHIDLRHLENEEAAEELSLREKKAAIARYKKENPDWKQQLKDAGKGAIKALLSRRLNSETMQTLHGSSHAQDLRDLNNPMKRR